MRKKQSKTTGGGPLPARSILSHRNLMYENKFNFHLFFLPFPSEFYMVFTLIIEHIIFVSLLMTGLSNDSR